MKKSKSKNVKLNIGGWEYEIITSNPEKSPNLKGDNRDIELLGCICFDENKIYINDRLKGPKKAFTILHELLHAIFSNMNNGPTKESFVKPFSHMLYNALKQIKWQAI